MTPLDAKKLRSLEGGPSFALGDRVYRLSWDIAWLLLCRWTPPPLHGWRRFVLRLFGAQIAPTAHVYGSARIWSPRLLRMAAHSCLARDANCYNMAMVTLGKYVIVSQGAHLCGGTHDVDDPHFQLTIKPITLMDSAWVAAEAFVGPGVTMAEGAVLGARGVTFKDIAAYEIHAGNPARLIRQRLRMEAKATNG